MQGSLQQKGWVKTAVFLIQWWLRYDADYCNPDSSHQVGHRALDPPVSLLCLMQSLVETSLLSESALPNDLAYFGSTCFQDCMQQFSNHAAHLSQSTDPLRVAKICSNNRYYLRSYKTCLGKPPCFHNASCLMSWSFAAAWVSVASLGVLPCKAPCSA